VASTGTTTGILEDDEETGVGGSNVDDLKDTIHCTEPERYMLGARGLRSFDDLSSLLGGRGTDCTVETFDGETLTVHLLLEGEQEAELTRGDVQRVESHTNPGLFCNLCTNSGSVIMTFNR
jgi:hypothetical protein